MQLTPPLESKRQKTSFGTTGSSFDPCFSRLAKLLGSNGNEAGLKLTQLLAIKSKRVASTLARPHQQPKNANNLAYCIPIWNEKVLAGICPENARN